MKRIQDKSRENYQSELKPASSQKLQLDMWTRHHNISSTVEPAVSRWMSSEFTLISIFFRLLLYLMNSCKASSKILRCYFCYIYRYLIANRSAIEFLVHIKDNPLELQLNDLPHKKEVPSHNLQAVSQGQGTKGPFNKHQILTLWTYPERMYLLGTNWFPKQFGSVVVSEDLWSSNIPFYVRASKTYNINIFSK